jgi:hypothetical protein
MSGRINGEGVRMGDLQPARQGGPPPGQGAITPADAYPHAQSVFGSLLEGWHRKGSPH